MKVIPEAQHLSAPELAARALDRELNHQVGSSSNQAEQTIVNDLTMVVKKKKKPAANASTVEANGAKRKAEDDAVWEGEILRNGTST